jgi:hypothetical protein
VTVVVVGLVYWWYNRVRGCDLGFVLLTLVFHAGAESHEALGQPAARFQRRR